MNEPRRGTIIDDKFRLRQPIGAGAMGSVWLAEHLALETDVAVKFIASHLTSLPEARQRFETEAKAAARIRSPHVVQIFDHGVTGSGLAYIVMELLDGETLDRRLERTGWLSIVQCDRVITQLAKALDRAHALGVVHRDIKPENIFLCAGTDGLFAKLLDFGVAKLDVHAKPGVTLPGSLVGTVEYMSLDQVLSSRAVDAHADLWALAVLAYELLTAAVPFTGDTFTGVCMAICAGEFAAPSTLRHGLSPRVDAWFSRAFARRPEDRYANALQFASEFRAALRPSEDGARPKAISEPHAFRPANATALGVGRALASHDEDEQQMAPAAQHHAAPPESASEPPVTLPATYSDPDPAVASGSASAPASARQVAVEAPPVALRLPPLWQRTTISPTMRSYHKSQPPAEEPPSLLVWRRNALVAALALALVGLPLLLSHSSDSSAQLASATTTTGTLDQAAPVARSPMPAGESASAALRTSKPVSGTQAPPAARRAPPAEPPSASPRQRAIPKPRAAAVTASPQSSASPSLAAPKASSSQSSSSQDNPSNALPAYQRPDYGF